MGFLEWYREDGFWQKVLVWLQAIVLTCAMVYAITGGRFFGV